MDSMPWIYSKKHDLTFLFLPIFITIFVVFSLGAIDKLPQSDNDWSWLFLIVFIDVAHVWSTIFRTYLHKNAANEFNKYLVLTPLFCFTFFTLVCFYSQKVFWTVMAYLALFHFMRQQVGILNIYLRKYSPLNRGRRFSTLIIWLTMLTPVIDWHTQEKVFSWFVKGDFFFFDMPELARALWIGFFIVLTIYFIYELYNFKRDKIPANLLIILNFAIWGGGISLFNNDFAFTLTNVVHHGLPYLYLIWTSSLSIKKYNPSFNFIRSPLNNSVASRFLFFFVVILTLAVFEEYLWDLFIWHERAGLFGIKEFIELNPFLVSIVIGLLSTPQTTHYLLDGIIWKKNNKVVDFRF